MHPITVYTRKGCTSCAKVKQQLKTLNVSFQEMVIDVDVPRAQILEWFPGVTNLPILVEDGRVITIEDLK
jgi:glutaredoxin